MTAIRRIALVLIVYACALAPSASAQTITITGVTPNRPNPSGTTYTYVVVARTKQNLTVVSAPASAKTDDLTDSNWIDVGWRWTNGAAVQKDDVQGFDLYRTMATTSGATATVKLLTLGKDNGQLRDNGIPGTKGDVPPASFLAPAITATPPAAAAGTTATYVIVARSATGALTPSPAASTVDASATLDDHHYNDVAWSTLPMSQSYDVWRTAGGVTTGRIATVVATGAPTYQLRDTGLVGDGAALPDASSKSAAVSRPGVETPLTDGKRIVSGSKGEGTAPHSVAVIVLDPSDSDIHGNYAQRAVSSTINTDGSFAVALMSPLMSGQRVWVCARAADDVDVMSSCNGPNVVESPDDWGRVRAYFAAGVVFSQDEGDFSQQDLALSFTLDKVWAMRTKSDTFWFRAFNTFFDTRLTSEPVQSTATTTTTTTTASPAAAPPTPGQQFIDSRKAAVMQAGLYVPHYSPAMTWTHAGQKNAVFLALPVVKFGVLTTGTAPDVTTAQAGTATAVTTATVADGGVYKFYAVGFGVGHEKLPGNADSAPEIISYLHATFGKWENFSKSAWRMAFEGRLKIPTVPFQVGFDANIPMSSHDSDPASRSDLRFIVGTRFDFGELLGKLRQF